VGVAMALACVVRVAASAGAREARGPARAGAAPPALHGWLGSGVTRRRAGWLVVLAIPLLVLGSTALSRARVWHDDISLWTAASRVSSSPEPAIQPARAYDEAGRHEDARAMYERLLETPERLDATGRTRITLNLGASLGRSGRYREAAAILEQAVLL